MNNHLKRLCAPVKYMKQRYPKAAKKRRIVRKWQNRFPEAELTLDKLIFPVVFGVPEEGK